MEISQNARTVLERRYLAKDGEGKPTETVEGLFRRVAKAIAVSDLNYNPDADVKALEEEFYQMMTAMEFLPNSPTLVLCCRWRTVWRIFLRPSSRRR